jgi:phosphoglycolate phosphatase
LGLGKEVALGMKTTHLILDFDGTLIDSSPAILDTLAAVLRASGIKPVRPVEIDIIGPPLLSTLQTLTGLADRTKLEALATDFRRRYDSEGIYSTAAYPGVADALRNVVASGGRLSLATNKRLKPTRLLLEHFGWLPWFDAVYCVDSRTPPFAHKGEMLLALLDDRDLVASQCVYVGDTNHDAVAAAHAGLRFVAVGWGYGVGDQAVAAGSHVLASPAELLDL